MSSLTASEIARFRDKALGSVPAKYRQPDVDDYGGRTMKDDSLEIVDYVPQTHVRIWYNCQMEGYELHHHAALEIIYCVQNTYTVTAGRETFSLGEGDILFIPPNVIHRLIGGVQGVRFIMLFDLEPASMFRETRLLAPVMNGPFHLRKKDRPDLYCAVQERFERMIDLYFSQQAMWEISVYTEEIISTKQTVSPLPQVNTERSTMTNFPLCLTILMNTTVKIFRSWTPLPMSVFPSSILRGCSTNIPAQPFMTIFSGGESGRRRKCSARIFPSRKSPTGAVFTT